MLVLKTISIITAVFVADFTSATDTAVNPSVTRAIPPLGVELSALRAGVSALGDWFGSSSETPLAPLDT